MSAITSGNRLTPIRRVPKVSFHFSRQPHSSIPHTLRLAEQALSKVFHFIIETLGKTGGHQLVRLAKMKIKIIEKYRQEADKLFHESYNKEATWRLAILESIFRPTIKVPGKTPMSHLHPNIDKLHLPENIYIADWRKYRVEDHPALVSFQKRCHAAGLHDPWLRNYAFGMYPNNMSVKSKFAVITTGLGFGFVAAAILYTAEKIYDHYYPTTYKHTKEYIEKYGTGERHH